MTELKQHDFLSRTLTVKQIESCNAGVEATEFREEELAINIIYNTVESYTCVTLLKQQLIFKNEVPSS